jgi:hemerythrin-like domain-containing protein
MKRHVSLQPLSRDHYGGLVQAKHLTEAADEGPDERAAAIAEFTRAWQTEISDHFEVEERLLLPWLGDEAAEAARLREEHGALRALAQAVSVTEPDTLRTLGNRLHDHIRWEERELFPLLERTLSEEQLRALETPLWEVELRRPRPHPARGQAAS